MFPANPDHLKPPQNPMEDYYLTMDTLCRLLERDRGWVFARLAEYGDPLLLKRAQHWHRVSFPLSKKRVVGVREQTHYRGHLLLAYLRSVGLPLPVVNRLLWDRLREDWRTDLRRTYQPRKGRLCQLPPWEAMSKPSSESTAPTSPPCSLKT